MKTTALFFLITLFIPMIYSVRISADKFTDIQNQISGFCDSITGEGKEANFRYEEEKKWCVVKIKAAEELVEKRKKEVEALDKQKTGLENKIKDNDRAIEHYQNKTNQNIENMKKFKTERCEANFNYISLLREHYDAEELLKNLKKDLDDYLDKKIANPEDKDAKLPSSFIQRVSTIGHLLPSAQQTNLIQLVQAADKYAQAGDVSGKVTDAQGNKYDARLLNDTLHVDNTRDGLKALEHVKSINPKEYFQKLKLKIDNIIDGLIAHLVLSKDDLSRKEMLANQDYAKFMIALEKENKELAIIIAGLQSENVALKDELVKTIAALVEFQKLLKAAEDNLAYLRQICKEKEDYNTAENGRRAKETTQCQEARKLFDDIIGTDVELKKLINNESNLTKSDIVENKKAYEDKRANNKAADIKIVF